MKPTDDNECVSEKDSLELKDEWTPRQLNQWKRCDGCGMPCQSKKLRPDDSGGYSIFCKGCIEEGRAIAQLSQEEREELGFC